MQQMYQVMLALETRHQHLQVKVTMVVQFRPMIAVLVEVVLVLLVAMPVHQVVVPEEREQPPLSLVRR